MISKERVWYITKEILAGFALVIFFLGWAFLSLISMMEGGDALKMKTGGMKMTGKTKCQHCGSPGHGFGCPSGPGGLHVHTPTNPSECVYCGSTGYGSGCPFSDNGIHVHGHGKSKCTYCGSSGIGSGCPFSPSGDHVR